MKAVWTREPPTEVGIYWHWSGDADEGAVPLFVGSSRAGVGRFVYLGQVGLNKSVACKEYGGWWCPVVPHPPLPKAKDAR